MDWDDGVLCKLPFVDHEDAYSEHSEDDEADGRGGVPGKRNASELESEEPHEGTADDEQTSRPVNGNESLLHRRLWVVKLEEEHEDDHANGREGQVDVEAPSPSHLGREDTTKNRPNGRSQRPHHPQDTKVHAPIAHGEEVTDGNVGEHDEAAAADALDGARGDEHAHAVAEGAQQRADPEDDGGGEDDGLAAKDVGDFAPGRDEGGVAEQVRRADPDVALARVELLRNGRDGGGDDGHVQRREEERQAEREHDERRLELRPRRFGLRGRCARWCCCHCLQVLSGSGIRLHPAGDCGRETAAISFNVESAL